MADLIDRDEAIDALLRLTSYDTVRDLYEATVANKYEDCYEDGLIDAIDVIVALASPQPEPIRPKAKNVYYEESDHCEFKCSLCHATIGVVEGGTLDGACFNFCPNCGAEMEDGDE